MILAVSATVLEILDGQYLQDIEQLVQARIKSWKESTEILHNHPELEDVECEVGETWGVSRKIFEVWAGEMKEYDLTIFCA